MDGSNAIDSSFQNDNNEKLVDKECSGNVRTVHDDEQAQSVDNILKLKTVFPIKSDKIFDTFNKLLKKGSLKVKVVSISL